MAVDPNQIHPELRRVSKKVPKLPFNRYTLWLFRFLSRLQPNSKISAGIHIERVEIPSQHQHHKLPLRVYRPPTLVSPAPVLLWLHGGGYIIGKPEMDDSS